MESSLLVEMRDIRKKFSNVFANDGISLTLRKGEVLALLGENGAGKSTLMSILYGMYKPDFGDIYINGQKVAIRNPVHANRLGIGMVHQHFKLVHNFTVTENVILGLEPWKFPRIDLGFAVKRIREISERYGLAVDPDARIEDISVGMQQRVEILKMLYRKSDVLIFDEPTAVLMPSEIKELMSVMKSLISEGKSIILITHKLKEIKSIADRCMVIRRGKLVGTVDVDQTTTSVMAQMMVGREVNFKVQKEGKEAGDNVLSIRNLSVMGPRGVLNLKDFSLDIRAGEILGLAGVDGNGQDELVNAIFGMMRPSSGKIMLNGKDITHLSIRDRIVAGISHIPGDRQKQGLILDFSIEENLILSRAHESSFSTKGFLNRVAIGDNAHKIIEDFDIRSGSGNQSKAASLSGGNQQKTVVGREISNNPDLLIAVQPTRGLDVGSIEYIHQRIVEQRNEGKAVLLVSLELDEVLDLSDRIAVVSHGELVGVVDADEIDENSTGLMMCGIAAEQAG